jgi:hypothetical protein
VLARDLVERTYLLEIFRESTSSPLAHSTGEQRAGTDPRSPGHEFPHGGTG